MGATTEAAVSASSYGIVHVSALAASVTRLPAAPRTRRAGEMGVLLPLQVALVRDT